MVGEVVGQPLWKTDGTAPPLRIGLLGFANIMSTEGGAINFFPVSREYFFTGRHSREWSLFDILRFVFLYIASPPAPLFSFSPLSFVVGRTFD